jgi:hypothetical protein
MIGRAQLIKPNCAPELIKGFINDRIRTVCNRKVDWSGMYRHSVLFVPRPYNAGTITFNYGSDVITGTSTAWPVNDVVNTVISAGVRQRGINDVIPGDMSNITPDTLLLIDVDGPNPEIVTPIKTSPTSFRANFLYNHNPNCTVTCSSMAGRQLRTTYTRPIYNVTSVKSATEATIDIRYFGEAVTNSTYRMVKIYFSMDPGVKYISSMRDKQTGYPIKTGVQQAYLNYMDPQRSATGPPILLADMGPLPSGNMGYELYPQANEDRQLDFDCFVQPDEMVNNGDRPPFFINPSMIMFGVYADMLRNRVMTAGAQDPYYDPSTANSYEMKFEKELDAAMTADASKTQSSYSWGYDAFGIGGANWRQSHSPFDYNW